MNTVPAYMEPTPKFRPAEVRPLPCPECKEDTEFILNEEGTFYLCGICGTAMEYHCNCGPHLYAIMFFDFVPERRPNGLREKLHGKTTKGS